MTSEKLSSRRPEFLKLIRPRWLARVGLVWFAPLVYLVFSLTLFWAAIAHPTRQLTGGADTLLSAWYFEWYSHALTHGVNPFVTQAVGVPGGLNLAWNNGMFPLAVVSMPFVAVFGAIPTIAYLAMLSPVLSACSAYFVLRRMTGRCVGPAFAGALFGFGPFMVAHQSQVPLVVLPLVPLIALAGYRLLVDQSGRILPTAARFGALVGVQFLMEEEVLAMVVITMVVAIVVAAIVVPREFRPRVKYAASGLAVAIGVCLAIVSVPLYYQFFGHYAPRQVTFGSSRQADLVSFVAPGPLQQVSPLGARIDPGVLGAQFTEQTAFLGWPLILILVAVGAFYLVRRDRLVCWWLLTTLAIASFTLGRTVRVDGHVLGSGPWEVVSQLPLLGSLLPGRFTLMTALLVSGLIAVVVSRLQGVRVVAAATLLIVAFIPLIPSGPYRGVNIPATPTFFSHSRFYDQIPAGAEVAVLPIPSNHNFAPMVWQLRTHMRFNIVGGYSLFARDDLARGWGYTPQTPAFAQVLAAVGQSGRPVPPGQVADARKSVADSGIGYIIVTAQAGHPDEVLAAAESLTGCTARLVADVTVCTLPGQ